MKRQHSCHIWDKLIVSAGVSIALSGVWCHAGAACGINEEMMKFCLVGKVVLGVSSNCSIIR